MVEPVRESRTDAAPAHVTTVAMTGGTGFIGKSLIHRFLRENIRVRALVRPASISSCFNAPGLSWIHGELNHEESLRQLLDGASAVIYCAGSVRGASMSDFVPANVSGVAKIVHMMRNSVDSPRFLLISSLAARSPELSHYAASKRQGEEVLRSAADGLDWTIIRPPAVYGPGDREMLSLLQWLRRGIAIVPAGGRGRFSLIFIDDLAEAVLSWLVGGAGSGGCFELHDGKAGGYCWEEVCEIASELYRRPVRRVDVPRIALDAVAHVNLALSRLAGYLPMLTPGKVRELCHEDWVCDHSDFSRVTRWAPEVGLREGLLRTLG
ncbi:NAD-dependent epimerase/dehydratase family protein [Desulfoglaeba alkanexedens]|uniref:NAD-dependent epimerase/dehydratase family protein n=1 Tax=Desulfoglaeba alkanexedens ALDC TaxID=980445 RepID=A0A4V1ERT5_9BACT|nr:NAD-dependent epimerase/dehydratase family protein [Desulfoglaeba alkanexedens]QCQ22761.1 NAD-dependent epimerase/dehydratase family protein [Desulfoglaeba alkanexedens ALDC]